MHSVIVMHRVLPKRDHCHPMDDAHEDDDDAHGDDDDVHDDDDDDYYGDGDGDTSSLSINDAYDM